MKNPSGNNSGHLNNDSGPGSVLHPLSVGIAIHIAPESLFTSLRNSYSHRPEYARKDGSRIRALFAGKKLRQEEFVEFMIDVTERRRAESALRESERRFRLYVQNVQEYALFQNDPERHILPSRILNRGRLARHQLLDDEKTGAARLAETTSVP